MVRFGSAVLLLLAGSAHAFNLPTLPTHSAISSRPTYTLNPPFTTSLFSTVAERSDIVSDQLVEDAIFLFGKGNSVKNNDKALLGGKVRSPPPPAM